MTTNETGEAKVMMLELHKVRRDERCQSRERLDMATVMHYAEELKCGAEFPPVACFFDGATYWLADGFLRLAAHEQAGRRHVACHVRPGGLREARLWAAGANARHGLPRS